MIQTWNLVYLLSILLVESFHRTQAIAPLRFPDGGGGFVLLLISHFVHYIPITNIRWELIHWMLSPTMQVFVFPSLLRSIVVVTISPSGSSSACKIRTFLFCKNKHITSVSIYLDLCIDFASAILCNGLSSIHQNNHRFLLESVFLCDWNMVGRYCRQSFQIII